MGEFYYGTLVALYKSHFVRMQYKHFIDNRIGYFSKRLGRQNVKRVVKRINGGDQTTLTISIHAIYARLPMHLVKHVFYYVVNAYYTPRHQYVKQR